MIQLIADGLIVPIVIVGGLAIWFWTPKPRLEAYKYALMAGLTSLLVAKLISLVYHPAIERPFQLLGQEAGALYIDNPGFPSDHALFVTVIVLAVYALTGRKKIAYILAALALLVGVGRVLALVHTPFDVVGGVFAGLVGGLWYLGLSEKKPKRLR
ncbi:phosphatase PAP2 family protein [Candidatus Saccharibacteria bacterium]|nr:MAG: phosphatase PAP2 family protein [Candidatus Saccharibacteria bacterium]